MAKLLTSSKTLGAVACAGFLVFLAVFGYPLATGRVYIEDDLSAFNLPLRYFYQQCLVRGDSPLWMPSMFCGYYLHGEGQAGLFHPLHYALYRWLPLGAAFNLELLLDYPALFLGTWLLLRRWRIPNEASLLGAFLFACCGFGMSNYLHIMMPSVIAHMPWLLLCVDVAMRSREEKTVAAACAGVMVLTASQWLLGFPQCVYLSSLIEGLYALWLLYLTRNVPALVALGIAKALSVLLGGLQILPQLEAARHSIRLDPSFEFIMSGSLHPLNLVQIFSPYVFNRHGWTPGLDQLWDPPYFGAIAPLAFVWAAIRYRDRLDTRKLIAACGVLALLGIVLAMGKYGYLYRLAAWAPLLNKFRNASRHLLLFHLAASCVVALAFADLTGVARRTERMAWRRLWPLGLPLALSLVAALAVVWVRWHPDATWFRAVDDHLAPTRNAWLGVILMAAATILALGAARGHPSAPFVLILFVIADVSLYGLRHKPSADLQVFIDAIEVPADAEGFRIDPDYRPVYAYTGPTMKGYKVVHGYAAMIPFSDLDYSGRQLAALRVAGVRWRKTRHGGPPELAQAADRGVAWLEVPDPMPRARLVSHAEVSADPRRDIERIDMATTALVSQPVALSGGAPGEASIVVDRPGRIDVKTSASESQLLVLAERWHEGWHATLNGASLPIVPVYGDFMGCLVPPGTSVIEFRFTPSSLRHGLYLSATGLIFSVGFLAALVKTGRLT